ncbi:MAG: hypothetical protein IJZ55_10140 [Lachnospiraceae bacterium]|nr:hypothetical protein [Lachnospiraceae bacterium]
MQEKKEKTRSKEEFRSEVCGLLKEILGAGYETEVSQVRKNNGVMKEALFVRKENSECIPCFYTEELYRSYCMGEQETALAEYLANIVLGECETMKQQAGKFLEKEWIEEHLFLRLLHGEQNREYLKDTVCFEFLDLVAVVCVLTEDGEDEIKSYQLPKHVWELMGFGSADEYFPKIVENTRRLFPEQLVCMEQIVLPCSENEERLFTLQLSEPQEKLEEQKLYILSNRKKINGATTILYPGILKRLGERFEGDFYVIPSSVHEVLVLKNTDGEELSRLNEIVREVNDTQVEPEEVLSHHVYFYSVEKECLLGS